MITSLLIHDILIYSVVVMNVLRMVKLFGWEKKMDERVSEKREAELKWIWRRQFLDLVSSTLK